MNIRPATKDDLKQCAALIKIPELQIASGDPLSAKQLLPFLDKNYFLVAEENKQILGCIVADPTKANVLLIWFLVIKEGQRGKGVGTRLLQQIENNAKNNNVNWIVLHTPENCPAIPFYEKHKYNKGKTLVEFNKKL